MNVIYRTDGIWLSRDQDKEVQKRYPYSGSRKKPVLSTISKVKRAGAELSVESNTEKKRNSSNLVFRLSCINRRLLLGIGYLKYCITY